ncbi:MAG TPA: hypothetical protein VJR02_14045 [Pyrinomonadaceae bacterium]|nr:hypothetical protein [Pyrinomonadaceae bacterium]
MTETKNSILRPEARPIPFWKHPRRAKEALQLIIAALKESLDSLGASEAIDDLSLDPNRVNRIFFISGEPGSGKSTLYWTLKAMLGSKGKTDYRQGYQDQSVLSELEGAVRLLDPIDLEVAGDEGENLLAAVLVRIIEDLDRPQTPSSVSLSDSCRGAIKELEDVATDIGIAWEGNLKARAGALDPDTYSVEVMRTQRARLGVNDRLSKALHSLASHNCFNCESKTLFVLPVDDFYLKPDASLQLLRLLRMISIPRLFFLVMGDINTVEALFIEKSLHDWTAVAGASLFPENSPRLEQALTRARELRARYLRKLLPPGQRETIEAMDWYEALNVEVSSMVEKDNHREILEELLDKVHLDSPFSVQPETKPNSDKSLLRFLVTPALPPLSTESKENRQLIAKGEKEEDPTEIRLRSYRSAYTALQILDATPREVVDLASSLRRVLKQESRGEGAPKSEDTQHPNPALLSGIRDIVNLVREEHSFLNEDAQEILGGVLPTRTYYPEDINFQMDRLRLRPPSRTWRNEGSILYRTHRSWDLSVKLKDNAKQESSKDPFEKLPPRPAAWFILLHDLAWIWNSDSVSGNLVHELINFLRPSINQPELTDGKETLIKAEGEEPQPNKGTPTTIEEWKSGAGRQFGWCVREKAGGREHLPLPNFDLVRDVDRFLFIWNKGLTWLARNPEIDEQRIVDLWRLAGQTVLLDSVVDLVGASDWYSDFAMSENEKWFKDFAEAKGETFEERFARFSEVRGRTLPGEQMYGRLKDWIDRDF